MNKFHLRHDNQRRSFPGTARRWGALCLLAVMVTATGCDKVKNVPRPPSSPPKPTVISRMDEMAALPGASPNTFTLQISRNRRQELIQ